MSDVLQPSPPPRKASDRLNPGFWIVLVIAIVITATALLMGFPG